MLSRAAAGRHTRSMSEESSVPSAADDVKAKMKEALDRKHAAEQAGESHLDTTGRSGATHGKTGGQQRFQRKSG